MKRRNCNGCRVSSVSAYKRVGVRYEFFTFDDILYEVILKSMYDCVKEVSIFAWGQIVKNGGGGNFFFAV